MRALLRPQAARRLGDARSAAASKPAAGTLAGMAARGDVGAQRGCAPRWRDGWGMRARLRPQVARQLGDARSAAAPPGGATVGGGV